MSKSNEKQEWVNRLCVDNNIVDTRPLTNTQVTSWLTEYNQVFSATITEESFRRLLRKGKHALLTELNLLPEAQVDPDEEILLANVNLQKQKQKYMDTNRIERKSFREYARIENAVVAYGKELKELLINKGEQLADFNPPVLKTSRGKEVGMIGISDAHLNELIDLPHNKYDISVASHRLYKFYKEALSMFTARGITEVVVAFTGDLLNSDRRLDEMLNQATNRAKATFIAVDLFKQFLLQLTHTFKVSVVSVLGNESRANKEMSFSNEALSDNYDFTIVNMVKLLMEASGNKNIIFGSLDEVETVIEVMGHKILLTHDLPRSTSTQKGTQSVIGKQYLQGNEVDCLVGGHIHDTLNGTYGYRSSSLAGANSYSDNALHLAGRAAQNIYFIGEGYRHVMGVDLQEYVEGEWFDIDTVLMEYNAKSVSKTQKTERIMSIVI